ncbi:hypothetical protein H2200_005814 [Cladophialophora chaetospira]|uniref:Uncharacterized protein n=1 Tax=Cladophialophora chaetospira TaxID=386627 RepID=A0AA38X9S1_9EURO|nr:hypothetical protein H2200_005814 [Cladophialophora chaetospira]
MSGSHSTDTPMDVDQPEDPGEDDDIEEDPEWERVEGSGEVLWKLAQGFNDSDLHKLDSRFLPYVAVNDNYIRMTKEEFAELVYLKDQVSDASIYLIYISAKMRVLLETATPSTNSGYPYDLKQLVYRDLDGVPKLAKYTGSKTTRSGRGIFQLGWKDFFVNGTKPSSNRKPSRFVDPKITIQLRPDMATLSALGISLPDFKQLVEENVKKTKANQEVQVVEDQPDSDFVFLDIDPFLFYETWAKRVHLKPYVEKFAEREKKDEAAVQALATHLQNQIVTKVSAKRMKFQQNKPSSASTDDTSLEVELTNLKQTQVLGKKRNPSQKAAMGNKSATDVATTFGWKTPNAKIPQFTDPTSPNITWSSGGLWPAEWLHKSGWAWGGVDNEEASNWSTSQQPKNLIFGTSETNSVMIRTETAWQNLFKTEAKITLKTLPQEVKEITQRRSIKGTLVIKAHDTAALRNYRKWDPATLDLRSALNVVPPAVAEQRFWLWYAFDYHLQTQFQKLQSNNIPSPVSHIFKTPQKFITTFYPFQRLFFLKAQRVVDDALLGRLESIRTSPPIPQHGAIHKPDTKSSFISRPVALHPLVHAARPDAARHTEDSGVFNTNALLTALLESSDEPPVTVENSEGRSLVASTAPQNMAHASLWESALRNVNVEVNGVAVRNVAFATIDNDGHLAQISAASLASSQPGVQVTRIPTPYAIRNLAVVPHNSSTAPLLTTHGFPGGSVFDNQNLQTNPAQATPPGYVLTGDIQLFGMFPAKLYAFQGTASDGGVHEVVTISDQLPLASLFPSVADGDFGSLRFENVQFRYDDGVMVNGKESGTWLEGDVVFEGTLQPVADILKSVFNQSDPKLHVELFIGVNRNWTTIQMPGNFAISGLLPDISADFAGLVKFTSLGVTINFTTITIPSPYSKKRVISFSFFGRSLVTVPGSVVPLSMDFTISVDQNIIILNLTLRDDDWQNAFGIPGLTLSSIELGTNFDYTAVPATIAFDMGAVLTSNTNTINFTGYYNHGDWGLIASIYDLQLEGLVDGFWEFFGGNIDNFDADIEFDIVELSIDPSGISLTGDISVNGHQTAEGTLAIDREGISIIGSLAETKFGDLTIKNPSLDVFIGTGVEKASRRELQFAIKGNAEFKGIEIDVSVYMAKSADEGLLFTVYGEYDNPLASGALAPELQGSFLDIPMTNIALLAGNTNTGLPGFVNKYGYPLIKGVQLNAQIGSIPALNSVTGINLDGLTLAVGLVADQGLTMSVVLPTDKAIHFTPTVSSGPIAVSVEIARPPSLSITAGLNVLVAGQAHPLVFTMGLNATVTSASGFAQMDGFWVNPFGISPNVQIGPNMTLQLGLNFVPPSVQVGGTGGLMIGNTAATVSLSLGASPSQELIAASLAGLSCNDLIAFASQVAQKDIPRINSDVFDFESVAFSISTGVQVGTVYTSPGASLAGKISLFGEHATVSAFVKDEIKMSGEFDAFHLGPLAITGAKAANPTLEFELGPKAQKLLIDGAARLLELDASLHVEAELLPSPAFEFDMGLAFTELLPFTLHGAILGALDIKDVSKLDFDMKATLEQKILDYLMTQANLQFVAAEKGAKEGFDTAKAKLDQVEASFQAALTSAQASLDKAQIAWDAKSKNAVDALNQVKQSTAAQQALLESRLTSAQGTYNQKVNAASQNLDQTRVNAANAIASAQASVQKTTIDSNTSVAQHQTDYNNQKASMDSKFGNAKQSIANAQQSVQNAQNAYNDCEQRLSQAQENYNKASVFNKPKFAAQIAAIKSEEVGKRAALATAQGALSAAQAVLNGLGYDAAVAALQTYKDALDASVSAANAAIAAANSTLAATSTAQNAAISAAQTSLDAAKNTSVETLAFQSANKAVTDFLATANATVSAAQASVDALSKTAEGLAFTAAQNALAAAKNNTADLDIARHALDVAQATESTALNVSQWMVNHIGNFVNIEFVEISGTLRGLVDLGKPMVAHIKGVIASSAFDYTFDYSLGRTPDLIKSLFENVWADLNGQRITLPLR